MNLKDLFIRKVLREEGDEMLKYQGAEMQKRLKFHTRRLYNDRKVTIGKEGEMGGVFQFTFPIYERFLDMKMRRGYLKPKLNKDGTQSRRKLREPFREGYRMHNRFVFYRYKRIANRLQYGFTEEVRAGIREEFRELLSGDTAKKNLYG